MEGVETLKLFSKMKEEGIEPDRATYTDVLTQAYLKKAREYLNQ